MAGPGTPPAPLPVPDAPPVDPTAPPAPGSAEPPAPVVDPPLPTPPAPPAIEPPSPDPTRGTQLHDVPSHMQSLLSPLAVIPPEPVGPPPSIPTAPPPEHAPTSNSEHGSVKTRRKDLIPISGSGEKVGRTTRDHAFGLAERRLRTTHRSQQREGNFAHVVTNLTNVLVAFEFPARLAGDEDRVVDTTVGL